ncbi:glutathione-regulated potassium-efflux system ancillary protein KefF [Variovorax paradoxus]|uniref:glutathione-regulated potassium-efflux system oxidoreductase KefF n=1 Tax=Variovorax paradoxus TaxID=34073 RepID=UPI002787BDF0|nr:NAD(P)H-dependent oxidoreductase [Variovorax paradoxus]MDP9967972.1 glutathione-regulated potassium-efflux system ancillary protein KefF [Variovorax paradoxus]
MTTTTSAAGDTGGIYVLAAHPHWRDSRVNRRMLAAARGVPGVEVNDLYGSYPDFAIDVEAEHARLARASLVVLLHPIQWYSMPALQKLWLDDVLSYGWAYGPGGTALQGKDCWLVATTGSPEPSYHPQSYHRYFFDAFLPPYEQTAALCGMRFLPPLVLHGARSAAEDEVATHVDVFAQRLGSYPQWPELEELEACVACPVPETDRPAEAAGLDEAASAANEEQNDEKGMA